jgi:heptosyltransferase-1
MSQRPDELMACHETRSSDGNILSDEAVVARYRDHYRKQDAVAALVDRLLHFATRGQRNFISSRDVRRILLANAGHLGDAVMSTALLPAIKHAYPDASIGFLTGSYCRPVIQGHHLLDRVHYIDHWRASRTKSGFARKISSYYLVALPKMVQELRAARYDVAIDLHAWFPNFIPLLWLAEIPIRVGFSRLGCGSLLTHPVAFQWDRRHEIEHQLDLLRNWGVQDQSIQCAQPVLPAITGAARASAAAVADPAIRYRVLHPASSTSTRDWTIHGWSSLASRLCESGITPVISGAGPRDQSISQVICAAAPGTVDAVGKLNWEGLMALLSSAEMIYSVETSIGHAAAALGRPVVSIYGGMADPLHWAPRGAALVTKPLPCFPCFNKHGCADRPCLLDIGVRDVEIAADCALATCAAGVGSLTHG